MTAEDEQLALWPPRGTADRVELNPPQRCDTSVESRLDGALKTPGDPIAETVRLHAELNVARPISSGPPRTRRGALAPVVDAVPFTAGRWALAKGGRSVNLPNGGKIRQEAADNGSVPGEFRSAANMRLVQAAPALYALAQDFLIFLSDGGAVDAERNQLASWITALETWVRTGEEIFDEAASGLRRPQAAQSGANEDSVDHDVDEVDGTLDSVQNPTNWADDQAL